jgi:hypothetical protein
MSLRIPLAKGRYLTILSVYAPTLVSDEPIKDCFYDVLYKTLQAVPRHDKLMIIGDFNARVGSDYTTWGGVIGKHGVGNVNSNGLRLLTLCSEFDLVITNTLFQQRDQLKTTWMHPRSKHWHLLDYVLVRRSDSTDVTLTRAMRGAECWTDHRLLRSTIVLHIRPPARKKRPVPRLNTRSCKRAEIQLALQTRLAEEFPEEVTDPPAAVVDTASLSADWEKISSCLMKAAKDTLGYCPAKHQDWFDDSRDDIMALLKAKNEAHAASLQNPHSQTLLRQCQKSLRSMQNEWWLNKAKEIQSYADSNATQKFYDALKAI